MTVALSFPLESLPENMEFFAIVNRLRGTTEDGRWGLPRTTNVRFFKYPSHPDSLVRPPTFVNYRPRKFEDDAHRGRDRDPSFDTGLIAQDRASANRPAPLKPSV